MLNPGGVLPPAKATRLPDATATLSGLLANQRKEAFLIDDRGAVFLGRPHLGAARFRHHNEIVGAGRDA